ncbi:MAG: nuclear transport factor 2 family protein [Dehalococcoidia bacterium]
MNQPDYSVIAAWHDALNTGDVDRLITLSSDDVEVVGPRGAGRGAQLLRDWVTRSGIRLELRRLFARDSTAVAEEVAEWRAPDTSEIVDRQHLATIFRIEDGRVSSIDRRPTLADALHVAGLDESNLRPA